MCTVLVDIRAGLRVPGMVLGGYTGWVIRRGTTRAPTDLPALRSVPADQRPQGAGPCCRQGWVGSRVGPTPSRTHPRYVRPACIRPPSVPEGPVRPLQGLPCRRLGSSSKRARFHDIFLKVSQKRRKCHQKVLKRPVIVPVLQNGLQKSPLDFPGICFWPAFSHKELMGLFDPWVALYCQNDEVSTGCTRSYVTRKGRQIPPQPHCG